MQSFFQREKKRQWSQEQNNLLKDLYPNYSSKRWKKISQIFKQKGFDRSQLQIRERWTNFEDPALLFTEWTNQQLETLYKSYTKFGSKWCFIKKTIPGRTQNKIKNKFYGNIRIFLRFVVNYFNNSKEDTMWIHKINPSILNDIYRGSEEYSGFGNQMETAIKKMNYNVDKIQLLSRIQSKEGVYRIFYQKIISLFKTIQQKKFKAPICAKQEMVELSQINYGSQNNEQKSLEFQPSQKNQKPSFKQVVSMNIRPEQIVSNNTNSNWPVMGHGIQLDPANYPLLQLQNPYPYYNCWFYQN